MSALVAITCEACGGSVAMEAGKRHPACLFCGATRLVEEPEEEIEAPGTWLPFQLEEEGARLKFQEWASKKFWAPTEIRRATLDLHGLLLPAWMWSGRVETHWAALVRASTRSGKRPTSGSETLSIDQLLIPASRTLKRAELADISPFDASAERPFEPHEADLPFELGQLTRSASRQRAMEGLREEHASQVDERIGATRLRTSCLFHDLDGRPVLLPIWIGAYRHGDQPYRVVVNGQTGEMTGTAPISWAKVAAAVAAVSLLVCGGLGVLGLVLAVAGS